MPLYLSLVFKKEMGASSSISNYVYISSSDRDKNAMHLSSSLADSGYNTIQLDMERLDPHTLSTSIDSFIAKSVCIIVCINEQSLRSFHQMIEINNILQSNKKIIYVMTDEQFTPENTYLNGFVKQNTWFKAYDDDSLRFTVAQMKLII